MEEIILHQYETSPFSEKIRKVLHYTGLPCDARTITDAVLKMEATAGYPEPMLLVRIDALMTAVKAAAMAAMASGTTARAQAQGED